MMLPLRCPGAIAIHEKVRTVGFAVSDKISKDSGAPVGTRGRDVSKRVSKRERDSSRLNNLTYLLLVS